MDNRICAPLDSLTGEAGAASVTLTWMREPALAYSDMVYVYRAVSAAGLAGSEPIGYAYYYNDGFTDYFLNEESLAASYYYGAVVVDKRGVASTMKIFGPISPLSDSELPAIEVYYLEDGQYINGTNDASIYITDNSSLASISAVFIAEGGTETAVSWSPKEFDSSSQHSNWSNSIGFDGLADGNYTLRIVATDVFNNQAVSSIRFVMDTVAPAAPTVTASSIPGKIDLRWTAAPDADVAGYRVYSAESEDGDYYNETYYTARVLLTLNSLSQCANSLSVHIIQQPILTVKN